MADQLIVSGASGQLGAATLNHLVDGMSIDPSRIIAVTRTPERLASYAARGVQVRAAGFDDTDALSAAFTGGTRLLLISTNAFEPGQRLAQHRQAIDVAVRSGVQHIVYTSLPRPAESTLSLARDHEGTEALLAASGVTATLLRNNWYFENLFFTLPAYLGAGTWHTSAADGRIAFVSRADCARVAAAVLASGATENAAYDVTGDEALSIPDIARLFATQLSAHLELVKVPDSGVSAWLRGAGFPPPFAQLFEEFEASVRAGHLGDVSDTVRRVTGQPADRLGEWLLEQRQAFVGKSAATI